MNNKLSEMKEQQSIKSSGYRVPEGYFDQMRAQMMSQVADLEAARTKEAKTVRPAWRSAVAFAASFAAMVVLAIGGYYLTGGAETQQAELAAATSEGDMWLYGVDEVDLYEASDNGFELTKTMVAEAAIDYLETFGSLPSGELSNE